MLTSSPVDGNNLLRARIVTLVPWVIVLAGLCSMYTPTFVKLFQGNWSSDQHAHGPIVLAISLWLLYRKWPEVFAARATQEKSVVGHFILIFSLLLYILGRSQSIELLEVGSFIWVLVATALILLGTKSVKVMWFPLFFMLFMIPLPGTVVTALTMPMKIAVSYVAEQILYAMNFPIARTGVILQIGQYQLLVADACAGLQTLFTLESLGLLYLNLIRHESLVRNLILAIMIVPISFAANVIRVIVLTLITYFFGDEAGQGFLHEFAGMVLFLSALLLIIGTDTLARTIFVRGNSTEQKLPE
jgi:exosortase B